MEPLPASVRRLRLGAHRREHALRRPRARRRGRAGLLGCYLLGPSDGAFERGPYLVRLTDDSATARLEGARRQAGRPTRGVDRRARGRCARRHVHGAAAAAPLRAGRHPSSAATQASGTFTTAPRTLAPPIDFGVIGDYGSGNDHEWAVGRVLAAGRPDFVLTAGDNSYLFALPRLLDRNIFEPLAEVMGNAPLWATFGEHDTVLAKRAGAHRRAPDPGQGRPYTVRYGPVQIVLLGLTAADEGARAYARRELTRPGPKVRFVVVHRPILRGNPILPFLRGRVAAVFSGTCTATSVAWSAGVLQFVVGTGGEGPGDERFTRATPDALTSLLDYGALRVAGRRNGVQYRFVDERGRVLDRARSPLR